MFERFTDRARRVVVLSQEEARQLSHPYIGTEHLLLGLIKEGEGVGAKALEAIGIELDAARREIEQIVGPPSSDVPAGHLPFTPRAKKVLELSLREALQLGHNYIGTEHILLGLLREDDGLAAVVLRKLGAELGTVRQTVIQLLVQHGTVQSPTAAEPAQSWTGRLSPALRSSLEAASARAADAASVGTQHVLAIFAEWDYTAAHAVLRAGGFDPTRLEVPIVQWDVAGTGDETTDEWARRVTQVVVEEDAVSIRVTDPALRDRIRRAMESGLDDDVRGVLGSVFREAADRLPEQAAEPEVEGS